MPTTWDATFEASPADTDQAKYGAGKIRELKTAISERMELEHNFKAGTQPSHIVGKTSVVKVDTTANIAALTGMGTGSIAFDTTLGQWKVYDGANWTVRSIIPSGSKALFYQDTAPTGWTIQNTLDDKIVYITKGNAAGGQTGGGVHSTGSWTISNITADGHVLTEAEMPVHTHVVTTVGGSGAIAGGIGYTNAPDTSGTAGGNAAHTHTCTHTPGWRPAAYCCIICAKN